MNFDLFFVPLSTTSYSMTFILNDPLFHGHIIGSDFNTFFIYVIRFVGKSLFFRKEPQQHILLSKNKDYSYLSNS